MAKNNLIQGRQSNPVKKVYRYRYRVNGKTKSGEFNSVSNKAALRYCGCSAKGEPMAGGLLKNKLPKGAKITFLEPTGKRAKK